jgi:hypothetical protein
MNVLNIKKCLEDFTENSLNKKMKVIIKGIVESEIIFEDTEIIFDYENGFFTIRNKKNNFKLNIVYINYIEYLDKKIFVKYDNSLEFEISVI